jgi:hypothetical protein
MGGGCSMDKFMIALFYQIPEGVILSIAGLGLLGIKKPLKNLALVGALYGAAVAIIRWLFQVMSVPPWVFFHTLLLLPVYILIAKAVLKISAITSTAAWMFSVLLIMLGEQTVMTPLGDLFNLDFVKIIGNPKTQILWGWIGLIPLLLVAAVVSLTDFVLIQAPQKDIISPRLSR